MSLKEGLIPLQSTEINSPIYDAFNIRRNEYNSNIMLYERGGGSVSYNTPESGQGNDVEITFADFLKYALLGVGITQQELARKVNIHSSYISKLESGKNPPPTLPVVRGLADSLKMDKNHKLYLLLLAECGNSKDGTLEEYVNAMNIFNQGEIKERLTKIAEERVKESKVGKKESKVFQRVDRLIGKIKGLIKDHPKLSNDIVDRVERELVDPFKTLSSDEESNADNVT